MNITRMNVPIEDVYPNARNPRNDMGDIAALAASIKSEGQLEALLVIKDGSTYTVVAGHRRLEAMKSIPGMTHCDVNVVAGWDEADALLALMADNSHRKDFDEVEKSRGLQPTLLLGVDPQRISDACGDDVETLRNAKRGIKAAGNLAESMTLEQLVAIDEFADDTEAADRLIKAGPASWKGAYEDLVRKRKKAIAGAEALKKIAAAGAEFLETRPDGGFTYEVDGKIIDENGCGCDGFSASLGWYQEWPGIQHIHWICVHPENHGIVGSDDEDEEIALEILKQERGEAALDGFGQRIYAFLADRIKYPDQQCHCIAKYATEKSIDHGDALDAGIELATNLPNLALGSLIIDSLTLRSYNVLFTGHGSYYVDARRDWIEMVHALLDDGMTLTDEEHELYTSVFELEKKAEETK